MLAIFFIRSLPVIFSALLLFSSDAGAVAVRVSNFSNITIPLWVTGDPDIVQDVFVCVYRENSGSDATRTYEITATGDGPGFFLKAGGYNVPYTLTWNDGGDTNPGGGSTTTMINNVALLNRQNARNQLDLPINSSDCNAGAAPTARIRMTISATAMDAARDGTFSGTLTFLVSPN